MLWSYTSVDDIKKAIAEQRRLEYAKAQDERKGKSEIVSTYCSVCTPEECTCSTDARRDSFVV